MEDSDLVFLESNEDEPPENSIPIMQPNPILLDQPKTIHIEEPKPIHIEQPKPIPIVNEEPVPIIFEPSKNYMMNPNIIIAISDSFKRDHQVRKESEQLLQTLLFNKYKQVRQKMLSVSQTGNQIQHKRAIITEIKNEISSNLQK